jgi:hypothetical protein
VEGRVLPYHNNYTVQFSLPAQSRASVLTRHIYTGKAGGSIPFVATETEKYADATQVAASSPVNMQT